MESMTREQTTGPRGEQRRVQMHRYLRGERTVDDLRREDRATVVVRRQRRHQARDDRFLALLAANPDVGALRFTTLARRTGIPVSTLFDHWRRLQDKGVRLVIEVRVPPDPEAGRGGANNKLYKVRRLGCADG